MKPADEGTVTVEGMSDALDQLVKATDALDVLGKGGDASNVEHSGHNDERGKVGGGRADRSDAGGLDNMMVGKMAEAGIPVDMIADFSAFMSGKQSDDEDEEEEEENGKMKGKPHGKDAMHGYDKSDPKPDAEPLKKAMDEFREDKDVADAVDVSGYLEGFTAKTADMLDGIRKAMQDTSNSQASVNAMQSRALHQMGSLLKSQSGVIDVLADRLGIVEKQPNAQRGAVTDVGAKTLSKGMPGEAGTGGESMIKSQRELLNTLSYMNLEKSIKQIGSQQTNEAIYLLEGGGVVSNEVTAAAEAFLAQNPAEAETARTYA